MIGALAVGAWGQPRATYDLDFMVLLEGTHRLSLISALSDLGFVIDMHWAENNPIIRDWHLRFRKGRLPLDVLLPRDAHDESVIARRRKRKLGNRWIWIMSPEDVILHKLKVGRPRDFEDALSVMVRQGQRLDWSYLDLWAGRLGIMEELSYLMEKNGS
ncbi:MAG: hypothetical protein D6690_09835 [Nitrospirae bacterium]|nr:MAG: hypothetical protein D6690_09835 [Nitrospirota bacterium]